MSDEFNSLTREFGDDLDQEGRPRMVGRDIAVCAVGTSFTTDGIDGPKYMVAIVDHSKIPGSDAAIILVTPAYAVELANALVQQATLAHNENLAHYGYDDASDGVADTTDPNAPATTGEELEA